MTATSTTVPVAGTYRLDPTRTSIALHTRHMFGLGTVAATFALREGEVVVGDPATATRARAVIDAASFASNSAKRDEHVRSAKFLAVADHPDITVDLDGATLVDGAWSGSGQLTVHGVSQPIVVTLDGVDGHDGEIVLRGSARVDRYRHGVTASKGMAGRWMTLTVTATATATRT